MNNANTTAASAVPPVADDEVTDLPTAAESAALDSLRNRGYAVVVFTAEELRGAKARHVEDRLVERGWEVIDVLADDEPAVNR